MPDQKYKNSSENKTGKKLFKTIDSEQGFFYFLIINDRKRSFELGFVI